MTLPAARWDPGFRHRLAVQQKAAVPKPELRANCAENKNDLNMWGRPREKTKCTVRHGFDLVFQRMNVLEVVLATELQ